MAQDIGTVYVQVAPSGKDFGKTLEGDITGSVDTAARKSGGSLTGTLGKAFGKIGKLGLGAIGTITGGVTALAAKGGFTRALNIENAQAKLKGLGHLFRLHQRIGPVQKQRVQIIGVQPFQNAVNAFQNMALGKIIPEKAPVIPDAAFGLEINPLPQRGLLAHGLCENLL